MEIVDSGVLAPSYMDFIMSSHFAQQILYNVHQFGHFYCNGQYHIYRKEGISLYLFAFVKSGSLTVWSSGFKKTVVRKDQIALVDCTVAHEYYCTEPSDFIWFHFDGNNSREYVRYLLEEYGMAFGGPLVPALERSFARILHYAQTYPVNEHMISVHVGNILGRIASPDMDNSISQILLPAIRHIREHYSEELSLDELADTCQMSKSHFIRTFSKQMNRTPHAYLLAVRLQEAKRELTASSDSIEQIAENCGFNSASHFARAFRKENNISPTEFREISF